VARTTNGGATWVEERIPQQFGASSISVVEFLTATEGWAGGFEGVYRRTPWLVVRRLRYSEAHSPQPSLGHRLATYPWSNAL
jgi:hypothetical protein